MLFGCQLDASSKTTGSLESLRLPPPRPTFTSPPHWRSDVLRFESVALAWFSPERLGASCDVEHFTRTTIPARNPRCPVLKVGLLSGILRLGHS